MTSTNSSMPWTVVYVAVLAVYVGVATPENTPIEFAHPATKAFLFLLVAASVFADVAVGTTLAFAVLLSISHATQRHLAEA
jgi:hypothetical protein